MWWRCWLTGSVRGSLSGQPSSGSSPGSRAHQGPLAEGTHRALKATSSLALHPHCTGQAGTTAGASDRERGGSHVWMSKSNRRHGHGTTRCSRETMMGAGSGAAATWARVSRPTQGCRLQGELNLEKPDGWVLNPERGQTHCGQSTQGGQLQSQVDKATGHQQGPSPSLASGMWDSPKGFPSLGSIPHPRRGLTKLI